jgi:hypothetical protein
VKTLFRCAIALICSIPVAAFAQGPPAVPASASEPQGVMAEPDIITRAVLFADRQLGKGDLTNGIYVDYGNMIPGAGWASVGPGYRHWYGKDSLFVDASASISVTGYRMAQARFELPALLKSRLVAGVQSRWQQFNGVDYFGSGSDSLPSALSDYAVKSTQLEGYVTIRPVRWLDLDGHVGWVNPRTRHLEGPLLQGLSSRQAYVPTGLALTIDTRDFPDHPTRGVMLRGAATRYDDRTVGSNGVNSFDRFESEGAGFVPIGKVVIGMHGWVVRSNVDAGRSVPFYFQPTLGGVSSLRSFTDYRFRDDNMLLATVEMRLALLTHLDLAGFVDAGSVARRPGDLDLAKRSYGGGLRFHTRRDTFAEIDLAHGTEGWRAMFRLKDPLLLSRLDRKTTIVPFVP